MIVHLKEHEELAKKRYKVSYDQAYCPGNIEQPSS